MNTFRNWLVRYKLYHIPFWFCYNYAWWVIAIGHPYDAAVTIFTTPFALKFLFYMVLQGLAACLNLYVLIPRLLEKGKFAQYFGWLVLTIIVTAICITPGYYLTAMLTNQTMAQAYGENSTNFLHLLTGGPLSSTIAIMTLAMSIKLGKKWLQTQRRQQVLEKEKLETELKFLRYQSNPHFLFNTINSIFFLIHKNPDKASNSLAKFSDMLRYQLYECNDKQIPLEKEIAYLENFIELEKLRQNENVEIRLSMEMPEHSLLIAPFILMTFVENAFKHVSKHSDQPNRIHIHLETNERQLQFRVTNTTDATATGAVMHYGGIGLQNVQRRLDLLYPDLHKLHIQQSPQRFDVQLQLQLNESASYLSPVNYLHHA
ncbi:histidine kinase [Chitinophaga horti]|uniref:Histidine kinase n=1 Tax=Chitinophaga horti TaxID=2920382 RepID=A0ABY6IX67_9BACT|nr:histidine kinase [Chitinophaga horti]UYQ90997.1 histidine kinase [Chitinophaga horti]